MKLSRGENSGQQIEDGLLDLIRSFQSAEAELHQRLRGRKSNDAACQIGSIEVGAIGRRSCTCQAFCGRVELNLRLLDSLKCNRRYVHTGFIGRKEGRL